MTKGRVKEKMEWNGEIEKERCRGMVWKPFLLELCPASPRSLSALVLQVRKGTWYEAWDHGLLTLQVLTDFSVLMIQHFILFYWITVYELGLMETISSILTLPFSHPKFGLCKTNHIHQGRLGWRDCFIRSEGPGIYYSSFPRWYWCLGIIASPWMA